jgi:hypothetical protein
VIAAVKATLSFGILSLAIAKNFVFPIFQHKKKNYRIDPIRHRFDFIYLLGSRAI